MAAETVKRDAERLEIETVGGIYAGPDLIHGNASGKGRTTEREASS